MERQTPLRTRGGTNPQADTDRVWLGGLTRPSSTIADYVPDFADVSPPTTAYARLVKPVIDRVLGAVLLVALSPLMLLIWLLLRASLGRRVIFRQVRVGQHGEHFEMLKFRTMAPDRRNLHVDFTGPDRRQVHKTTGDPRHTSIGRVLRRLSLDELPQLWNVVRGDMSLVGPRPELPSIVRSYDLWQHSRHMVKPGLTGLWQVSVRRTGTLMHEHTEVDLEYIRTMSPLTDAKILMLTAAAAVTGD